METVMGFRLLLVGKGVGVEVASGRGIPLGLAGLGSGVGPDNKIHNLVGRFFENATPTFASWGTGLKMIVTSLRLTGQPRRNRSSTPSAVASRLIPVLHMVPCHRLTARSLRVTRVRRKSHCMMPGAMILPWSSTAWRRSIMMFAMVFQLVFQWFRTALRRLSTIGALRRLFQLVVMISILVFV